MIGRTLGDFRLDAHLGGRVYRALQLSLNRPVALRLLDSEYRLPELAHPHLLPVYAAGVHDGAPFLVTRLVEGPSLASVKLPPAETLRFLAQIADALDFLHARSIPHGSVRLSNILLADDSALLADAGLRPGSIDADQRDLRSLLAPFGVRSRRDIDSRLAQLGLPSVTPGTRATRLSDAPTASPPSKFEPKPFGKFLLLEQLGHGGMGIVYKAEQTDLRRTVALKVLLSEEPDAVARFLREARSAARLRHPHIVPIHEVGALDGRHFFTMDLVVGEDLDRACSREKPPTRRAVEIVRDAARAIAYAHDQGVIHRDLKPANILLERPGGRVLVTDFGLAKDLQFDQTKLTMTEAVMGTPAYMAPEQAAGKPAMTSDVYALGAVLYHLLTGGPPHHGPTPLDVLLSVRQSDPVLPRSLNPAVHRDAETICLKALEKRPERRYASAAAFADDCDRFLAGEPIAARPVGTVRRLLRRAGRHRAMIAVALVTALVAAGAIGAWRWTEWRRVRRTVADLRPQADAAYAAGRLDEAERIYRRIAALSPDDPEAATRADDCARRSARIRDILGRLPLLGVRERFQSWSEILEINSEHDSAFAERGLCRLQMRDQVVTDALDDFRKTLDRDSGNPIAHFGLALFWDRLRGNWRKAVDHYEAAARSGRDDYRCLVAGATLLRRKRRFDEALAMLERADPDASRAHARHEIGNVHAEQGRYVEAEQAYSRALELDPQYLPSLTSRAAVRVRLGRASEALVDARRAHLLDPLSPRTNRVLGRCYRELKEKDKARAALDTAVELDPDDPESRADRARFYVDLLQRPDLALVDLNHGIAIDARNASCRAVRGKLHLDASRFADAEADLRVVLEEAPDDLESMTNLGAALFLSGRAEESLPFFDRVLERRKDDFGALCNRAAACGMLKRFEEAERDYRRAAPQDKTGAVWNELGRILISRTRLDEAEEALTIALRMGFVRSHVSRAHVRILQIDLPGALVDLRRSIELGLDRASGQDSKLLLSQIEPFFPPERDPWAGFAKGSWVRFRFTAAGRTKEFVRVHAGESRERRDLILDGRTVEGDVVQHAFRGPTEPDERGEEEIDLPQGRTRCSWVRVRTSLGVSRFWYHDSVPGRLVRMTFEVRGRKGQLELVRFGVP